MTGLNAVAQWLLGGGGAVLKFILYLIVAWILIGALPRMRRDAADKVPRVRGTARTRMQSYSASGRRKPAEWWGWTAAWGALSLGLAGAGFGKYMVTSAWHGWGDHKRRVRVLRARAATVQPPWRRTADPEPDAAPPPDDGGNGRDGGPDGPPPDGGQPGTAPAEPPQATAPDQPAAPAEPPQSAEPPQPAAPPQPEPELQPAGTGGPGNADVIPFAPRNSPASENKGEKPVASEIQNLEAAIQVVSEMQRKAQQELDAATAEKSRAQQELRDAEQAANDLAAAGVKGPVMTAFTDYYEATERAELAAASKMVAAEQRMAAANAARGALAAHQDAAERLAATGGAADSTKWYGQAG